MSAILALIGPAAHSRAAAPAMLGAMSARGGVVVRQWSEPDGSATLAVARHPWESELDAAAPMAVADDAVVVTDAALYHRRDLLASLAAAGRALPAGTAGAALLLAAYRQWGPALVDRLEGDFAFIVWDRRTRRLLAARDFTGARTLHFAPTTGGVVIASTVGGVLAHPAVSDTLDVATIAEIAAGLTSATSRTAFRDVRVLPAGHRLRVERGARLMVDRWWEPPVFERGPAASFEDAAEALRDAIGEATRERMAPGPTSVVWMSGGHDSTAVFAAGRDAMRRSGDARRLLPISVSYPPGDSGREDELIERIAAWWDTPVRWLRGYDVAPLADFAERAATHDEPFAHLYERLNGALAAATAGAGARVALGGYGGDQLFYVSPIFLADLARRGKLRTLAREWRAKGLHGLGDFGRWIAAPLAPAPLLAALERLRGTPVLRPLERALPPWIAPGFAARHDTGAAGRWFTAPREGEGLGAFYSRWALTHPFFARVLAAMHEVGLRAGVEPRSPLLDTRIVALAATRPRWERSAGGASKSLLRRAMRGLLPPEVLAPRAVRTGTTADYMTSAARSVFPGLVAAMRRESALADLGIIDPALLGGALERHLREADGFTIVSLFFTLHAEYWLRGRSSRVRSLDTREPSHAASV